MWAKSVFQQRQALSLSQGSGTPVIHNFFAYPTCAHTATNFRMITTDDRKFSQAQQAPQRP